MKKVLVSILVYNKSEDAIRTIDCFLNQTYGNAVIQVLDNASSTDCVLKIRERFPNLKITRLETNTGYTGGNNTALQMGKDQGFDYVLISNDDVLVDRDFLSHLIRAAQKKPLCGIMGVVEEDYFTGKIRAVIGKKFRFWNCRGAWTRSIPASGERLLESEYVQGAVVLFARRALDAGLRFDTNLFLYGDEIELSFQLKNLGLKAYVDTQSRVRHKSVPQPYGPLQGYYIQRNRIYLTRKYASRSLYTLAILFMGFIELPIKGLLRSLQGQKHFAWACFLGFFDGIRGRMGEGRGLTL